MSYLDSKRIVGTNADRVGTSAISGGWKEVGRTTLGSSNATIDVASLTDKRYYMVLTDITDSSNWGNLFQRMGNGSYDSGSNYAYRSSSNGGTDSTQTSQTLQQTYGDAGETGEKFGVSYIANLSSKEKLSIHSSVGRGSGSGAGNAPNRWESTDKYVNTSNVINQIQTGMYSSGRTFNTNSEVVVLGYDPDDTHTDNFWEELADVTLSSTGDVLSSGTFTAKKYLWVQAFIDSNGGNVNDAFRCGNGSVDTSGNYSYRFSTNGASDTTATSQVDIGDFSNISNGQFINMFIVNNASNEKLIICDINEGKTGAGTAPTRLQITGKWANTSDQINILEWRNPGSNDYSTKSFIKVWGSN